MKTKYLIIVLLVASVSSWTVQTSKNKIQQAEWLVGTWQNATSKGNVYEKWKQINPKKLVGMSYTMNQKDTVIFENLELLEEDNKLFYIPTVKNQNKGLPVRFKSKEISDTELIFENLQHDFPQRISYKKISQDSLTAEISGIQNREKVKATFPMKKIK